MELVPNINLQSVRMFMVCTLRARQRKEGRMAEGQQYCWAYVLWNDIKSAWVLSSSVLGSGPQKWIYCFPVVTSRWPQGLWPVLNLMEALI